VRRPPQIGGVTQLVASLPVTLLAYYGRRIEHERRCLFQTEPAIRTVGLPIYKAASHDQYFEAARLAREQLGRLCSPLFAFVTAELSAMLGQPVSLDPNLAPPGFHVVSATETFYGGGWHVDGFPHWPDVPPPEYSVTLLLSDWPDAFTTDFADASGEVLAVAHQPGRITLFPSDARHRMGAFHPLPGCTARVTLQGHLARNREGFALFW
jgi:hypothetical protein